MIFILHKIELKFTFEVKSLINKGFTCFYKLFSGFEDFGTVISILIVLDDRMGKIMKKIFLSAALVLALSVTASVLHVHNDIMVKVEQEKQYKKIDVSQVPWDVLNAVSKKYIEYSIDEAQISEDGEYKLTLSNNEKKVTAHYKATGEFIKEA